MFLKFQVGIDPLRLEDLHSLLLYVNGVMVSELETQGRPRSKFKIWKYQHLYILHGDLGNKATWW